MYKPQYKVYISGSYFPEGWEFTGRIKYSKYSDRVCIYLEITYKVSEDVFVPRPFFSFSLMAGTTKVETKTEKEWISERMLHFYEVPTTTIQECENNS